MFIVLAVNIEKHDREQSEKGKDLDGQALGKNEKELLVIDNLSYQGHNIAVISDKIQFINKLVLHFKNLQGKIPKNPNIAEIPNIPKNSKMKSNGTVSSFLKSREKAVTLVSGRFQKFKPEFVPRKESVHALRTLSKLFFNRGFSRQPCCMARTIDYFSYGEKRIQGLPKFQQVTSSCKSVNRIVVCFSNFLKMNFWWKRKHPIIR